MRVCMHTLFCIVYVYVSISFVVLHVYACVTQKKHAVSEDDSDTEEEAPPPKTSLKRQSTSLSSVASSRSSDVPPLKKSKSK